jgi:hypothetical protein
VIEGIPVELLNGIGVVGTVLLTSCLLWRALTVIPKSRDGDPDPPRLPRLVTGREAQTYLKRAEKAEENVDSLVRTVGDLTAVSQLQKATIEAAFKARGVSTTPDQIPPAEAGDPA